MYVRSEHDRRVFEELLERAIQSGQVTQHNMGAARQYELVQGTPQERPPTPPEPQEEPQSDPPQDEEEQG